jgi:ribosomal protein S18 acetylase RimI-like enzyme
MKNATVQIISYEPQYAIYFERLNKDWIEEYFTLEPLDKYVLENPDEAILKAGGKILFAKLGDEIIGTAAIKPTAPGIVELTKMAVDKRSRGMGAGKLLCKSAIEEAKKLQVEKVILYSNTRQSVAINLYRQLGFTELPVEPGVYERANIKMELPLQDGLTREEIEK